ncbi:MAG: IS66 family insertion sequence element accessory protein TnpB [Planctomycetota bacterium]|jgi:hypothetical protein|nr:IS66 family insertion sequence element accessory protein TnpB [Planctomycetota bacterium]
MLTIPGGVKVFLCLTPVDMRLGFDRLAALAGEVMAENPLSGHLFVFSSRRRDRINILVSVRRTPRLRLQDGHPKQVLNDCPAPPRPAPACRRPRGVPASRIPGANPGPAGIWPRALS